MLCSLKIPLPACFNSVHLSPLSSHRTAPLPDSCYVWFCVSWDDCFHIPCDHPHEDLPNGADPVNGPRGLPNPWDGMQTIECVHFSGGGAMALIQLWSPKYQGPLMEKPDNGAPGKNLILPRPSTKLGKHSVLNKKNESSQWLTVQNMPDAERFIIMIPTLYTRKMKSRLQIPVVRL